MAKRSVARATRSPRISKTTNRHQQHLQAILAGLEAARLSAVIAFRELRRAADGNA
jgi:hypothetical protein